MNISKASEESSLKGQENGDGTTGSERPLKKARFAWQVKGKYHLKNEAIDCSATSSTSSSQVPSNENNSNHLGTEQNLEILGDYLLKQDFNAIESVITDPEKSLLTPSTSEKLNYPRYVSSYDNNEPSSNRTRDSCGSDDINVPMCMVVSQSYTEDQCIARWQARQMAKGFVDNTINRVLDSWAHAPLPTRFLALDVAEFINNLPGDDSIENEGILMAISAHGLQNQSNSSESENITTNQTQLPSPRSLSPLVMTDESPLEISNEKCEDKFSSDTSWTCDDQQKDLNQFELFPESSISYECYNDNTNTNIECEDESVSENHYDFLDTAVLFAIKNKGLTTLSADYG